MPIKPFFYSRCVAVAGLLLAAAGHAAAQDCTMTGAPYYIEFGKVSHQVNTDTTAAMNYYCTSKAKTTYFRVCAFLTEPSVAPGINPRYMISHGPIRLKFDLYYDAARTQLVGSSVNSVYPAPGMPVTVPGVNQRSPLQVFRVWGRIPPNQDLEANPYYSSHLNSGLYWSWSTKGDPGSCKSGGEGQGQLAQTVVTSRATVPDTCRITIVNSLDFGKVDRISGTLAQRGNIRIRCPYGTRWNIGLDNGQNADGTTRRMKNAAGQYIAYELYREASMRLRWGNIIGTNTVSGTNQILSAADAIIYGVVKAPGAGSMPAPGEYTDIVKITMTF